MNRPDTARPAASPRSDTRKRHPLRLALAMMLTAVLLVVLLVLFVSSALVATQTGSRWLLDKAVATLNDDSRALSYGSADGTLLWGMTLGNLHYQQGDNSVQVNALELAWSPTALFARSLQVDRIVINGLELRWHASEASPSDEPFSDPLAGILPLPMEVNLRSITLRDALLEFDGNQQQIASLQLSATLQQQTLTLTDLALDSSLLGLQGGFTARLAAPYSLRTDLQWQWQQALPAGFDTADMQPRGALHLSGDLNNLIISHQLHAPLQVTSDGNAVLDLFPQGAARSQSFSVLHQLPPQSPALAATPELQLRIASAEFSTTGWIEALHVTGLASLSLIDTTGASPLPAIGLSWNTLVDAGGLELQQLGASTPSGSFSSSGTVRWSEGLALNIDYSVREDDASQFQALLPSGLEPGALSSSGSISWQSDEDSSAGSFAIDSLQAELNGYPLSGGGSLSFGDGEYRLNGVSLRSASNLLRINGHLAEEIDLSWELQAPDLQTLSSLLAGNVTARGNVTGTLEQPRVDMMAQGEGLAWDDIRIDRLTLEGDYAQGQNNLDLNIADITLATQHISAVRISLSGQPDDHRGSVDVVSDLAVAHLGFSGALDSEESVQWSGNLREAQIRSELGQWAVREPVAVTASADALDVAPHCWRELQGAALCLEANRNTDQLTASARLSELPLSILNAPLPAQQSTEFPPNLLPRLPAGTTLNGELRAEVSVAGQLDAPVLQFSVDASSGSITVIPPEADTLPDVEVPEEELASSPQRFDWPVAHVSGSLEQGNWQTTGELTFLQPDIADTGISAQGSTRSRLNLGADGVLDGVIDIGFDDLSWLEAFVPQIDSLDGSLRGQARISGTLEAPLVGGNLNLQASTLAVPALGVQITGLDLSALSANGRDFNISGTASSGEGYLRIDSDLTDIMSDSRSLSLALNGENFELLNRPELHLIITPQLEISSSDAGINVSGTLLLPVVDARPVALPESALDVSRDTVLVGQADDIEPVRNAALGDRGILDELPLTGQIRVVLGDEVRFSGFGLTAHLAGELDLTQRAAGAPLAYGELAVLEGNYSTYGRSLQIEHGKLLFFGSIDNPALDIRAVRETEDFRVGVQMNGTLRNIRSQLFSTPTLPDGDIIAVLITGRPFAEIGNSEDSNALIGAITNLGINQSQSLTNQIRNQLGLDTLAITSGGDVTNSSLTFGKYLTPKIFLRYGLGLFETESTLAVDYTLTDRVKLEAQSGTEQSIDLTYTVER